MLLSETKRAYSYAIHIPGLPFNGRHPRDPCTITWITTHLPTPEGWKAELARLVDTQQTLYS